jgi:hypothetical protein
MGQRIILNKIAVGLSGKAGIRRPRPVRDVMLWHADVCGGEGRCPTPTEHNLVATIIGGPYVYFRTPPETTPPSDAEATRTLGIKIR